MLPIVSIHITHPPAAKMGRDLVVCELGSDHDVTMNCWRILSNNPQVIHVFEA